MVSPGSAGPIDATVTDPHDSVDSVTATRSAARLFVAAIVVGILAGLATWLFVAASHYGIELLWHALPAALHGVPAAVVAIGVVTVMTMLATVIVVVSRGRPNPGRPSRNDAMRLSGACGSPAGPAPRLTRLARCRACISGRDCRVTWNLL